MAFMGVLGVSGIFKAPADLGEVDRNNGESTGTES